MPKKPVIIAGIEFESKGDAKLFFKKMLHEYDVSEQVSLEHEAILRAAVLRHPEAKERIGSGVESFSVRSGGYGTQCFSINRTDGTVENFSIYKCI
ncbi:DCL family protein [Paracoccus sp. 22332]|uniref:DCL family protein n=1 Tax=Paracoccus sp. 22332 TaxID=3453913 RepID=UPI003F876CDC